MRNGELSRFGVELYIMGLFWLMNIILTQLPVQLCGSQ